MWACQSKLETDWTNKKLLNAQCKCTNIPVHNEAVFLPCSQVCFISSPWTAHITRYYATHMHLRNQLCTLVDFEKIFALAMKRGYYWSENCHNMSGTCLSDEVSWWASRNSSNRTVRSHVFRKMQKSKKGWSQRDCETQYEVSLNWWSTGMCQESNLTKHKVPIATHHRLFCTMSENVFVTSVSGCLSLIYCL